MKTTKFNSLAKYLVLLFVLIAVVALTACSSSSTTTTTTAPLRPPTHHDGQRPAGDAQSGSPEHLFRSKHFNRTGGRASYY